MLGATFCVPFIVFLKGMTIWITYPQPAPVAVVGSNPTKVVYLQRIFLIIVCEWTKNERMFVFVQRAVRSCALRTSRFSAFLRSHLSFGSLKREKTTVYQSIYISATSKVFCLHIQCTSRGRIVKAWWRIWKRNYCVSGQRGALIPDF